MVKYLNTLNKHIKYTLETQINNDLNFLALTISIVNNKFDLSVYRKPTQTDTIYMYMYILYINTTTYDSDHFFSQKISFFNSIFHEFERI